MTHESLGEFLEHSITITWHSYLKLGKHFQAEVLTVCSFGSHYVCKRGLCDPLLFKLELHVSHRSDLEDFKVVNFYLKCKKMCTSIITWANAIFASVCNLACLVKKSSLPLTTETSR